MSDLHGLREALRHSPDNVPLRLLFAQSCLDDFQFEEARESYEHVLRISPGHQDASLGIVRVLFGEARFSEAIVRAEALVKGNPSFAAAHLMLARLHLAEGDKATAIDCYRMAVKLDRGTMDEPLAKQLGISPGGQDPDELRPVAMGAGAGGGWREVQSGGAPDDEPDFAAEIEKPQQTFADVGGMDQLKQQIRMRILHPMKHPELFRAYGKSAGGGVLLYGPPGCGKTMISRATAGEIDANFFCIGLHDILDMWIGSSEKNLHGVFEMARANAPCVLFFDEVDALAADRKDFKSSATSRSVINQFLAELDGGVSNNDGVLFLGATNAPWHIDPAFRRPGRFDRTVFVPPPDEAARASIIRLLAKDKPVTDLDAEELARKTKHFSGADLKAVFDAAVESVLESALEAGRIIPVTQKHLLRAAKEHRPTTQAWFESAKNYALYANQGGYYDDVLEYLGLKKP
jgi:AAA+ superfamily predicted ATPase